MSGWLDRREEIYFRPRELTLALPLGRLTQAERAKLRERLQQFGEGRTVGLLAVPGLLALRCSLVETMDAYPVGGHAQGAICQLVLSCVHEGEVEDLMAELVARCGSELHPLLEYCLGYPEQPELEPCVAFLLRASRASDARTAVSSRWLRRRGPGELSAVLERRRRPRAHPLADDPGYGAPLVHRLERRARDEREWVRRAAELHAVKQRRNARAARRADERAPVRRAAHAKQHGLVEAVVLVRHDLPRELQHGVFVPGAKHEALIRLSNMSETVQHDATPDARGLALRLLDVGRYGVRLETGLHAVSGAGDGAVVQELHFASHPTFFLKDIRDYAVLRSILNLRDKVELGSALAVFAARRPRELAIFARASRARPSHPLAIDYFSMSAARLGPEHVVKYCLRPVGALGERRWSREPASSPDFLRERLRESLQPQTGSELELELSVIVPKPGNSLSVEDATRNWERFGRARRIPVARVVIPMQDPGTEASLQAAEREVFTPWNTLEAHRPLGNLNRARLAVYKASSAGRQRELEPRWHPIPSSSPQPPADAPRAAG